MRKSYFLSETFALGAIVRAITLVARRRRTFTVEHVRNRLAFDGYSPDLPIFRQLMAAGFAYARADGICAKSSDFVQGADPSRASHSARLVWVSCAPAIRDAA